MTTTIYASSTTFTCPLLVYALQVELYGGAAGGSSGGDGGGSGGYSIYTSIPVTPGHSYTVTVAGAGGTSSFTGDDAIARTAGPGSGTSGGSGTTPGNSTFTKTGATCPGPLGGAGGAAGANATSSANGQAGHPGNNYGGGGGGGGSPYYSGGIQKHSGGPGGFGAQGAVVLTYTPATQVTVTAPVVWDIAATITATRVVMWDDDYYAAGPQAPVAWNTLGKVTQHGAASWITRKQVTRTGATTWVSNSNLTTVTVTAPATWHALHGVTASRGCAWNDMAISIPVQVSWNTLGKVTPPVSRAIGWKVPHIVGNGKRAAFGWRLTEQVRCYPRITWDARHRTPASRATGWDTRIKVSVSVPVRWKAVAEHAIGWNSRRAVHVTRALGWDTRISVRVTAGNRVYGAYSYGQGPYGTTPAGPAITWDDRKTVRGTPAATAWRALHTVRAPVQDTNPAIPPTGGTARWTTRRTLTRNAAVTWRAVQLPRSPVIITEPVAWKTASEWTTPVSIFARIGWRVTEPVPVSTAAATRWDSRKTVPVQKAVSWHALHGPVTVTRAVSWHTDARVPKTCPVAWDSRRTVRRTPVTTWDSRKHVTGNGAALGWKTRCRLPATAALGWKTGGRVSVTARFAWDENWIGYRDIILTWTVRSPVTAAATIEWNTGQPVQGNILIAGRDRWQQTQ